MNAGTIELGALALLLGRTDRRSLHPDGQTYESVTDHTVMVGWLACAWAARYQPDLNIGLVAEYALVHDAVEAYAGDTATLLLPTAADRAAKAAREADAFERLVAELGATLPWLVDRIAEYEALAAREARWVKAVDKAAVKITHLLNRCVAPRRAGMTVAELRTRYESQYEELFGPGGYATDFPELPALYRDLVEQEIALFTVLQAGGTGTVPAPSPGIGGRCGDDPT